jgi:hypothetical protein
MRTLITTVLAAFLLLGFSREGDEQRVINELIATTERQLEIQKQLKILIVSFDAQQERFYQGEETKELASDMVETASKILKMAEENQLLHIFPPFFIEELKLFEGIGKKNTFQPQKSP